MKICHVILACFYIEGAGYQENMLPKYHKKLGHNVSIVTKSKDWNRSPVLQPETYINSDSIPVTVLASKKHNFSIHFLQTLSNIFTNRVIGLYDYLCRENPDVIFIHGCQHIANLDVIRYIKDHPTKLFVDQHGDYYNTPVKTLKQKFISLKYRYIAQKLHSKCDMFWGVTPWRVQYLREVYKLPNEKTQLLMMGGDDEKINYEDRDEIRQELRLKYDVKDGEILIVTGGKIDKTKNIHFLIEATSRFPNVKLLIFGKPTPSFEKQYEDLLKEYKHVINIGWISSDKVYDYFLSADLVVFPGTHSVLWEQAVACGVPCVVKHWEGMDHVNVNGNCSFIQYGEEPTAEAISSAIEPIISNNQILKEMSIAAKECRDEFLYSNIARKSICIK